LAGLIGPILDHGDEHIRLASFAGDPEPPRRG
jgi:hypothetical protein